MLLSFAKMQALGNDFMVVDGINQPANFSPQLLQRLADRRRGVGFDQLLLVEPPYSPNTDFHYRIFNADGSEVGQCGNGARAFAKFVRHVGLFWRSSMRVTTINGEMELRINDDGSVTVDMGKPKLKSHEIPAQAPTEGPHHRLDVDGNTHQFVTVNMGNPHAVLSVQDVINTPVSVLGKRLCEHAFFPEQANIGFMQVINRDTMRLRVYERGAGETEACGSGACAAVVAGRLLDRLNEQVVVHLPGGNLLIQWIGEGHSVMMTGPAQLVYEGQIEL